MLYTELFIFKIITTIAIISLFLWTVIDYLDRPGRGHIYKMVNEIMSIIFKISMALVLISVAVGLLYIMWG